MLELFVKLVEAAVLGVHLLCVNLAAASPLVCLWFEFCGVRGDQTARQLAARFGFLGFKTLLLGALIGLGYGWYQWDESYRAHLEALDSRLWFGIGEWAFSWLLLGIGWVWVRRTHWGRWSSRLRSVLWFLAGTNLLYHFPFFFQVFSYLKRSAAPQEALTSAEFRQYLVEPEVLSQSVHVIIACFAVTGVAIAWGATRSSRRVASDSAEFEGWRRWARRGFHLALWPSLLQIVVGFWILVSLPRSAIVLLTGEDSVVIAAFVGSILAALMLVHSLARGLWSPGGVGPWADPAAKWMIVTIWWMTWSSLLSHLA